MSKLRADKTHEFKAGDLRLLVSDTGGTIYADVFVPGEDESIFSIRLDRDEQTATVYDGRDDEGETIYEAGCWVGKTNSTADVRLSLVRPAVCPLCHCVQKPGEMARADGRCYPACLPSSPFLRGAKHVR